MWRGLEGSCDCQGQSHPDATAQGGSLGVKTPGLSGFSSLIISENFPSAEAIGRQWAWDPVDVPHGAAS